METQYKYTSTRLQSILQKLEAFNLSKQNIQDIKKLQSEMKAENLTNHTILSLLYSFQRMQDIIDFDLRSAERSDLVRLVGRINSDHPDYGEYSAWTKADDRKHIQKFYSWLEGHKNPKICDFISVVPQKSEMPVDDPCQLLEVREVETLINEADMMRDKALMALLWDTGLRPKEIHALDWKDITFHEDMMQVHVRNGKNGGRTIHQVESMPLMKLWKRETPAPRDRKPVFCKVRGSPDRITKAHMAKRIRRHYKNTDISMKRKVNLYAWRKARITDMASRGMTQPNMTKEFGWCSNSNAPLVYIRLAEKDVRKNMRKIYPGLQEKEADQQKFLGENIPEYDQSDLRAYSV